MAYRQDTGSFLVPSHTNAIVFSSVGTGIFTCYAESFGEIKILGRHLRYKELPKNTAQIIRIGDLVETINPEQYGVTYIPAGQRFTLAGPAFYPDKSECRSIHGTVMYIRTDNLRVILPCERQPGEPPRPLRAPGGVAREYTTFPWTFCGKNLGYFLYGINYGVWIFVRWRLRFHVIPDLYVNMRFYVRWRARSVLGFVGRRSFPGPSACAGGW